MKNLIIISFLLIGIVINANCQNAAPDAVKKSFTAKYADANSVKWSSEEENEWEAEFTLNGKEMSASFDNQGKWIESESEIAAKDLPAAVSSAIAKEFQGYKAGEMSIVESSELKGFEVALKKGESDLEVIFDKDGKVLKKTDVKEKEDDEKENKN